MNKMQTLIDDINKIYADNNTSIKLNSTKIDNLRCDLTKAENARLHEQEQWKSREEQWKIFCKQQEANFKSYVDSITNER